MANKALQNRDFLHYRPSLAVAGHPPPERPFNCPRSELESLLLQKRGPTRGTGVRIPEEILTPAPRFFVKILNGDLLFDIDPQSPLFG